MGEPYWWTGAAFGMAIMALLIGPLIFFTAIVAQGRAKTPWEVGAWTFTSGLAMLSFACVAIARRIRLRGQEDIIYAPGFVRWGIGAGVLAAGCVTALVLSAL